MTYRYSYVTRSAFTPAVEWHFFKLRAVPCSCEFQQVQEPVLTIAPRCELYHSTDGQGNALQWGSLSEGHATFEVTSEGLVEQCQPYAIHETPAPYYVTATRLTACKQTMLSRALQRMGGAQRPFDVAREVMHLVHNHIAYTPGCTDMNTTARQVYLAQRGVCQDYAHLMISLCRAMGLCARYVCGLITGEGQTHAWVEVSDGQVWLPFDPTHDTEPEWGYIKIAHGRDAADCPTLRGMVYGVTQEVQSVWCRVMEG